MNYFKKFLVLNLLVFSLVSFNAKPMDFVRGLLTKICNPVAVSLNAGTAGRVTDYVNQGVNQENRQLFRIIDTHGYGLRVYHSNPGEGGGCFVASHRLLGIARYINLKEKLKLGIAFTALGCLLYSGIYYFKRSDIYIRIPVLHTAILAGLSFLGYNAYKYFKNRDAYRNG